MTSNQIRDRINALNSKQLSLEQLDERNSHILMANYLSEIERIQNVTGLRGKDLAKKIETSASYLSQVFRGVKPLNFLTIAKIQRVLNVRFTVKVSANENSICVEDDEIFLKNIEQYKSHSQGTWIYKNIGFKSPNYQDVVKLKSKNEVNESKAKSA